VPCLSLEVISATFLQYNANFEISDKDPATVDTAIGALSSFIQLSDSTEASMDVRLVNKLLESPNDQIFKVTCGMLKRTALSQCENLVALLGYTPFDLTIDIVLILL
jgi:hypothetical protein